MAPWELIKVDNQDKDTSIKLRKIPNLNSNSGTKRKLQDSDITDNNKKSKMDPHEVQKTITDAIKQSADAYKAVLEENNSKLISAMDLKIAPLGKEVAVLSEKYDSMHSEITSQGRDMSSLTDTVEQMKASLKAEIVQELTSKNSPNNLSAYKYNLSVENERVNCNLIVHGLKSSNPEEDITSLLSKLSIPSTVSYKIMSVIKLGKDGGERSPSILVIFQNVFQRNEMFRFAKNLPKGVYFDRDVPLGYRVAYKNMKRKAYKYRKFLHVNTQISFSGHLLQLRYKDKEGGSEKGYTIVDEFYPSPEDNANHIKGNHSKGGATPSTSVNDAAMKKARETFILSGIDKSSILTIDSALKKLLKKHEHDSILKIDIDKGNAIITCDSKTLCQQICKNYNGKSSDGLKLNIELFDIE